MEPTFSMDWLKSQLDILRELERRAKNIQIDALKKYDEHIAAVKSNGRIPVIHTVRDEDQEITAIEAQRTLTDLTNTRRTLRSTRNATFKTPLIFPEIVSNEPSKKRPSSPIVVEDESPPPKKTCSATKSNTKLDEATTCKMDSLPSTSKEEPMPTVSNNNIEDTEIKTDKTFAVKPVSPMELPKSARKKPPGKTPRTPNPKAASASKIAKKQVIHQKVNKTDDENCKKIFKDCVFKKDEAIKAKTEALKKKNDDKLHKAWAIREAAEKEKAEQLAKLENEKKLKARQLLEEKEKQKEELIQKKKLLNQQKAQEVEIRRQKEEAARLAKLQELEREQKRLEEQRIKEQQEAEKLKQQRKIQEDKRMKELNLKREQRKPEPDNDPEIDDAEEVAKNKTCSAWSSQGMEMYLMLQPVLNLAEYFGCTEKTPNLKKFFGKHAQVRMRTSSAIWNTTSQYMEEDAEH